jgi:hypothetical protein
VGKCLRVRAADCTLTKPLLLSLPVFPFQFLRYSLY